MPLDKGSKCWKWELINSDIVGKRKWQSKQAWDISHINFIKMKTKHVNRSLLLDSAVKVIQTQLTLAYDVYHQSTVPRSLFFFQTLQRWKATPVVMCYCSLHRLFSRSDCNPFFDLWKQSFRQFFLSGTSKTFHRHFKVAIATDPPLCSSGKPILAG